MKKVAGNILEIFRDQEIPYFKWINDNPQGYVLNARKSPNLSYLVIHLASCRHISEHATNQAENAFTGRGFIKVCANNIDEINTYVLSLGATKFSNVCSDCDPQVGVINPVKQEIVSESDVGNTHPRAVLTQSLTYQRDSRVIQATLNRATGVCERCNKPAPFNRKSNREPYLEVHHTVPLSEGGADTVENTEGLCPNCHREAHFG